MTRVFLPQLAVMKNMKAPIIGCRRKGKVNMDVRGWGGSSGIGMR